MLHTALRLEFNCFNWLWAVHSSQCFCFSKTSSNRTNMLKQGPSDEPVARWYWEYERPDTSGHAAIFQRWAYFTLLIKRHLKTKQWQNKQTNKQAMRWQELPQTDDGVASEGKCTAGLVYFGFIKAFDSVSQSIIIDKLMKYRPGGLKVDWTAGFRELWSVAISPVGGKSLGVDTGANTVYNLEKWLVWRDGVCPQLILRQYRTRGSSNAPEG